MNYKIYKGDCLKILDRLIYNKIKIDAVICDPPYGSTALDWDKIIDFNKMWDKLYKVLNPDCPIILFGIQPFTTKLISSNINNYSYNLVWKKNVPTGMAQASYRPMRYHEDIIIFNHSKKSTYNPILKNREGKGKDCYKYKHYCNPNNHINMKKVPKLYNPDFVNPSSILEFNVVPNRLGKLHPTQKPVQLMEYLVNTYTNKGDVVLDFTMGSGSTGVDCLLNGRKFIGIEKESKYYEIAKKRLKNKEYLNDNT